MARLQILELPEGSGDDRPPFVLVVDECAPQRVVLGPDSTWQDHWQMLADKIGARGVIVTPDTINIPGNDTTAYLRDSDMKTELDLKLGGQDVREPIAADMQKMREANEDRILDSRQARLDAQRLADERTDIARDMDRPANHKAALTDALGMDRTRDWDDIINAAAGLRKDRDEQAAAIERVRQAPTKPQMMNADQERPDIWLHAYGIGVRAAKAALSPRNEPTIKPHDA